jgi:RNA polymerase sigma-70 factor (ECF subfamily)
MSETPTNPASDEKLMLAFVQGFPEALNELYRRYQQPIHGFFRRRIADSSRAEELTQETFLALLRAANRYEPRALFRTYLYAIALKILRAYRRKAIFRAAFLGRSETISDLGRQDATETGLWIRRAIGQLEPTDREILLLREFEQLSYAEIADLLHLPINTVRSRLFRARIALRELLKPSPSPAANQVVTAAGSASGNPQIIAPKGQRA